MVQAPVLPLSNIKIYDFDILPGETGARVGRQGVWWLLDYRRLNQYPGAVFLRTPEHTCFREAISKCLVYIYKWTKKETQQAIKKKLESMRILES